MDDSLNQRLKQLALDTRRHPLGSPERQRLASQLFQEILIPGRLRYPAQGRFPGVDRSILYAEGIQLLLAAFFEELEKYDPEKGEVLQWLNFLLYRSYFVKAYREYLPSLPRGASLQDFKRLSLEDLDGNIADETLIDDELSEAEAITQIIQRDPDGLFKAAHVQHRPQASFQYLALQRLIPRSWEDLASELDSSTPTLSSFYRRKLKEFAPIIRNYLDQ